MSLLLQTMNKLRLRNIKQTQIASGGEILQQIDAEFPNGEPVHIMKSSEGWHVQIGGSSLRGAPPAVSEREAAQIIMSA